MSLVMDGLKSLAASVSNVLADLIGQDIVAKSIRLTSGSTPIQMDSATSHLKLSSSGTTDYFTSNGTTMITANGQFSSVGNIAWSTGTSAPGALGAFGSSASVAATGNSNIYVAGNQTDGAAAIGVWLDSATNLANATAKVLQVTNNNGATLMLSIFPTGRMTLAAGDISFTSFTDGSGTTGNQTLNVVRGIGAFAAATSAITITNSFVIATSTVFCALQTNDTTAILKNVVPAGGSFTINLTANATGTTKVAFVVFN